MKRYLLRNDEEKGPGEKSSLATALGLTDVMLCRSFFLDYLHGHRGHPTVAPLQKVSVRKMGSCQARAPPSFRERMK